MLDYIRKWFATEEPTEWPRKCAYCGGLTKDETCSTACAKKLQRDRDARRN